MHAIAPPHTEPTGQFLAALRDARFSAGLCCPRCGGRRVQRWGSFRGRQRYRCATCRRTFSDLTGTPGAYIKKLQLWDAYGACLTEGVSVRRAARQLRVAPSTTFRWRHRLLDALRQRDAEKLSGWIELSSLWVRESQKGSRALGRPARRRGSSYWLAGPAVGANVVIACDRRGHVVTAMTESRDHLRLYSRHIEQALLGRLESAPILTAWDGRLSPASMVARRFRGSFHDARTSARRPPRGLAHIGGARDYGRQFEAWLRRFRGVATRYLPNYLIWHRTIGVTWRHCLAAAVLRWPLDDPG